MKHNWLAKSTVVIAILYPASLVIVRHSNGITDAVLALATLVLMAFLIFLLVKQARSNSPLKNKLLMPAVSTALFGNQFLNQIVEKPRNPMTIFMGVAFSVLLLAVLMGSWKNKYKNGPGAQTR